MIRGQRYRRGMDKGVRATCRSRQRRSLGLATLSCVGDSVLRRRLCLASATLSCVGGLASAALSCVGDAALRQRCLATASTLPN